MRIPSIDPTHANAHFCYAGIAAKVGQTDEAVAHFAEAVRLNPDFAEARTGLGIELGRRGKYDDACGEFTEAVRLKPNLIEARLNLGIGLLKLHKTKRPQSSSGKSCAFQHASAVAQQYLRALTPKP